MPRNLSSPTFEPKRNSSFVRNDNQRYFPRADPARTDDRNDFVRTESGSGVHAHYFLLAGTFCFNSSNQFSTTLI